jgi:hypothetical protein
VINSSIHEEEHVQEKLETVGRPYRETMLDRERTASMADEGGASGAEMDLIEQQSAAPLALRARRDRSWPIRVLVGALAMGAAAAVLSRFLFSGRKRSRTRRFKLR